MRVVRGREAAAEEGRGRRNAWEALAKATRRRTESLIVMLLVLSVSVSVVGGWVGVRKKKRRRREGG